MINRKAQGLPLNLIILAAIAALVLVLVIAFTIGGAGSFFSKIFKIGTSQIGDDISSVRTTCSGLCDQAQTISSSTAWPATSFCTRKFNIDADGDGKLGGNKCSGEATGKNCGLVQTGTKEVNLRCGDKPIDTACSVDISTASDSVVTCTYDTVKGCTCA